MAKLRTSEEAIRHGSKELNYTYKQLAELFGVSPDRIKQIALGYRQVRTERGFRMRKQAD